VPKLAALIDEAETDVLAYLNFPKDHRPTLHSDKSAQTAQRRDRTPHRGRRHLLSNEPAITRLVGAILLGTK
jgi:putative transposase